MCSTLLTESEPTDDVVLHAVEKQDTNFEMDPRYGKAHIPIQHNNAINVQHIMVRGLLP